MTSRAALIVRLAVASGLIGLGLIFIGSSLCMGLDPLRAIAGCALIYLVKEV